MSSNSARNIAALLPNRLVVSSQHGSELTYRSGRTSVGRKLARLDIGRVSCIEDGDDCGVVQSALLGRQRRKDGDESEKGNYSREEIVPDRHDVGLQNEVGGCAAATAVLTGWYLGHSLSRDYLTYLTN